ncbi:hypothetical protein [Deinococcus peraridilitoris]|uniref:Acetoacetate decarboxylase n=1 Tax=Deinococcus peraridilitoris (strain DSM 19664 / LMG 22246 / CIP 109416 / KR-200) TaxID=937777 RepID=L0A138_DEIPD|nr:hypothetical protein [Deinococcus peraridilitoris]AFZ66902.1 hypothetical protein Deipe_1353 [Deinococcus peraridilitoris DSM 19664]
MSTDRRWSFHGRGLLAFYRARADLVAPERRSHFRGGLSAVMLLDYHDSPVGAYRELLYVGGFFREAGLLRPSVTRILVDSDASVELGRRLWGLPKERADFHWEEHFVRVEQQGQLVAQFAWHALAWPVTLPVTTSFIPSALHTLAQPWASQVLLTTPRAQGQVRRARLDHVLVHPERFPDVAGASPLLSLSVTAFHLQFPTARRRNPAPA